MQSKWLDKKLNVKENLRENLMIVYWAIICLMIAGIFFIRSTMNSRYHELFRGMGYIFLIIVLIMVVFYFFKACILIKKVAILRLKNKNFTQKDLDLLDEELDPLNYKNYLNGFNKYISISYGCVNVTANFLVKESHIHNSKVDIFKITNLHKIIYRNSSFSISLNKRVPDYKTYGLIEFYDKNEEKIFAINELREDCQKILDYFKENRKDIRVEIMKA